MARKSRKNIMPQSAAPEIRISEEANYSPGERNTLESRNRLEGAAAVRIYWGFGDGQKEET